jgi:hypothetical protein
MSTYWIRSTSSLLGWLAPLLSFFIFGSRLILSASTVVTCMDDCEAENRAATRPWHKVDALGSSLNLTRPYPFYQIAHNADYGDELVRSGDGQGPSPFSEFCNVGCRYFHASKAEPTLLSDCLETCDSVYRYNPTVGYSDPMELVRLECRDGCQYALQRCGAGHYCSQVRITDGTRNSSADDEQDNDNGPTYTGGVMRQCAPGTYRDVAYDAVESCTPCPRGRYRERTRGINLESCEKCPVGTYTTSVGSTSKEMCLRCPAGTFTTEHGSEECKCITPGACAPHQLPSPADAEKRDTVPFIGRW